MAGEAAPLACGRTCNCSRRTYYYRHLYRRGAAKVQTSVHVAWTNHCIARSALLFSHRPWQCIADGSGGRARVRDATLQELAEQDVEAGEAYDLAKNSLPYHTADGSSAARLGVGTAEISP